MYGKISESKKFIIIIGLKKYLIVCSCLQTTAHHIIVIKSHMGERVPLKINNGAKKPSIISENCIKRP
jgi:hypothetical protein